MINTIDADEERILRLMSSAEWRNFVDTVLTPRRDELIRCMRRRGQTAQQHDYWIGALDQIDELLGLPARIQKKQAGRQTPITGEGTRYE